jgi:hypothetical protein
LLTIIDDILDISKSRLLQLEWWTVTDDDS